MIRYVTYVVSFRVHTLPWNSYHTYDSESITPQKHQ